jgi:hypothetical protein
MEITIEKIDDNKRKITISSWFVIIVGRDAYIPPCDRKI